ncbi:MAG: AEC family transporter [Clostridia bacterium]|nr:AEC family transporter [Clostridia bacterium]
MKDIFMFSFNAVMPILILFVIGYLLRRIGFADENFFKKANAMVFKVFLPVLLFKNVYDIESLSQINLPAIAYCLCAVLVLCLIGFITAKLTAKSRNQTGVITQCTFRSNYAIIGIPLAETLGGAEAAGFASILSASSIPLFNVLAVILLSHYSEDEHNASVKATIKKTAKNPLIIGVLSGVAAVAMRQLLPLNEAMEPIFSLQRDLPFIYSAISSIAKGTTPLALIVLGARFDFAAVKGLFRQIVTATFMRLVVAPLVGVGCAVLLSTRSGFLSLSATEYPALISLFSTPVAVSSAVMVGEIGGDEQLAGQLVVWTSVFSMLSMFAVIFIMKSTALI